MASRTGRLISRRLSPALLLALAAFVLGATAGVFAQRNADDHDRDVERARDASQIARFEGALATVFATTQQVAAEAAHGAFLDAAKAVTGESDALSFVLTGGTGVELAWPQEDSDALRSLASDPAIIAARNATVADAGAHVVAPVRLAGATVIVFVAPGYPSGTPSDVLTRRTANPAVVLGVVPFDTLRNPAEQPSLWPDAVVEVRTAQGRIGPAVEEPVQTGDVHIADSVWRVAVGRSEGSKPIVGWFVAFVALAIALVIYTVGTRNERERRRAREEVEIRSRRLQLIASTGASLQQSLDLAELLPAFAISVTDEFSLVSLSIALSDDDGNLIEVFRHGRPPRAGSEHVDLRRGWRTVGRLTVLGDRPLDDVSRQSLQAVADLLAIAVTNSQLFEREQQAVTRLSELDALKNAFLSTVSHELRTATTAVQGFADLLSEHWDTTPDDRRQEMARRIRRQSGSLRHLVDDLLDYARLDAERLRVSPRRVNLSEIVSHVTDSFSPLVSSHHLEVHAQPDLEAWADPIAIERILANLLSNAGKYAPAGTTVTVTVAEHEGRARLSVSDEGPGIPEAERRRVFVRFYRLDNAQTIRTHGAGIGLAILHDFAARSGAEVTIEDAPGGGALVHVDFPVAPVPVHAGETS